MISAELIDKESLVSASLVHTEDKLFALKKANDQILVKITMLHELLLAEEKKIMDNLKEEAFLKSPRAFFSK